MRSRWGFRRHTAENVPKKVDEARGDAVKCSGLVRVGGAGGDRCFFDPAGVTECVK